MFTFEEERTVQSRCDGNPVEITGKSTLDFDMLPFGYVCYIAMIYWLVVSNIFSILYGIILPID